MKPATTNLFFRNDTILGVCEAIGQDFGFHPNWLRVALASLLYFQPVAVVGTYVALGVIVALSRWLAPDALAAPAAATPTLPLTEPRLLEAGFAHDEPEQRIAA